LAGYIYCIDNDVLKKLATFELFDETLKIFDASDEQVNVLGTAKYKFQRDLEKFQKGKIRNQQNKVINYEKTIELAEKLPQIAEAEINQELFVQLSEFEGIDQGEAILAIHVIQLLQKDAASQPVIFTGDKNFLRALAKVELSVIQANFNHRIWCLEQLILNAINVYGFEIVRDKIVPVRDCDTAIKAVFGSGSASTPENSLATLNGYIAELRAETGLLLHPFPNDADEKTGDRE
jgi:uncharacterized LabA/DUF88 family protein